MASAGLIGQCGRTDLRALHPGANVRTHWCGIAVMEQVRGTVTIDRIETPVGPLMAGATSILEALFVSYSGE